MVEEEAPKALESPEEKEKKRKFFRAARQVEKDLQKGGTAIEAINQAATDHELTRAQIRNLIALHNVSMDDEDERPVRRKAETEDDIQEQLHELKKSRDEIKSMRENTRAYLAKQFEKGPVVKLEKGAAPTYLDSDGNVYVTMGNGYPGKIPPGGVYNFGKRNEPQWKKWAGKDAGGWVTATDEDIEREEENPTLEQLDAPEVMSKDTERPKEKTAKKTEAPKAAPPPPLEKRPLYTGELSDMRNPFTIPRYSPEPVEPRSKEFDMPPHIASKLQPEAYTQGSKLTLQEILTIPKYRRQRELFGAFLASEGGPATTIMQRYMDSLTNPSAMTDIDQQLLVHYQEKFNRWSQYLEEVRENTKPEDVVYMLKNNRAFDFLRDKVSPERATQLIKIHMDRVFMQMSPEQVRRVVESSRANRDVRRSDYYRDLYNSVTEAGSHEKIDALVFNNLNDAQRKDALNTLRPNFAQLFKGMSANDSLRTLEAIDNNRENIMQVLVATLSNDIEFKREVTQEIILGARVREVGEKTLSLDDAQIEAVNVIDGEIGDTDDLRRAIRDPKFQEKVGRRVGKFWEDMKPEEREELSYAQLQDDGKLPKAQRGFFSLWLSSIFATAFPDIRSKLANEFGYENT